MIEAEILTADDQVELLEGQILQMSPQQPPHAATTQRASDYLRILLMGKAIIRVQLPITLRPQSEPEPNVAVVRIDEYQESHPTPSDIFSVLEVADTTLYTDRKQKAPVYAKAGIAEYWVVSVNKRQIHVFREPGNENYHQETQLSEDASIKLVAFPEIEISIDRLFPPVRRLGT